MKKEELASPDNVVFFKANKQLGASENPGDYIPPVRHIRDIISLKTEFKHSVEMGKKVDLMKGDYPFYRPVRGDGECFYRSTMYSYFERVILKGSSSIEGFLKL